MSKCNQNMQSNEDKTILCDPATQIFLNEKSQLQASITGISSAQIGLIYLLDKGKDSIVGSGIDTDIHINDKGVSRQHVRVYYSNENYYIEDLQSSNGTYVNGERLTSAKEIENGDLISIGLSAVLKFNLSNPLEAEYQKKIRQKLVRDDLTNTFNKSAFVHCLRQEFVRVQQSTEPLCLLMIDIDHFKRINDTFGHLVGDNVLIQFAKLLRDSSRKEDYVCRYGGEEFAIVCPDLSAVDSLPFAERIRAAIESFCFMHDSEQIAVTASIGISNYPENGVYSVTELVACADKAMYEAKNRGRNRIAVMNTNA